ncbi:ABZJ_00895 family protein [Marinobacter fonticola]|uniref:ABZJ_00895 family protein n=1 Tax=Marinobacter fonticola TaxID=2603215 RepID=UPI0011E82AA2|nr:ABZJ_00895 family protein [Marinobacter fonticola]
MITKCSLIFSALYAAILFCTAAAQELFNFTIPSAANFGYSLAAAYGAMMIFVSEAGRVPEKVEKRQLALGCTLGGLVVSVGTIVFINYFLADGALFEYIALIINGPHLSFIAAIMTGTTVLTYFLISLVFGLGAKKYQFKLEKTHSETTEKSAR